MFIPHYFKLYEVMPQGDFYRWQPAYGDRLWYMFDVRLLVTLDRLRRHYGKLVANTWMWGGRHQYRGWRPMDVNVGAQLSQHKFGRAIDLIPLNTRVDKIRQDIIDDPFHEDFVHITTIEADVSWLHLDVRNHDKRNHGLLIVKSS